MGAHNQFADDGTAKAAGEHHVSPPSATGGVIDLQGKDGALVYGATDSTETWELPLAADTPAGFTCSVINTGSGTVTITTHTTDGGTTLDTVTTGNILSFVADDTGAWHLGGANNASDIAFDDSGSKTTATTVDGALDEMYVDGTGTGRIGVPLTSISKEDGTQMIKQATTVTGFAQFDNKAMTILIPANSTAEAFSGSVVLPADTDLTAPIVLKVVVSKGSDLDTLTLDAEIYELTTGVPSWGADTYLGAAVAIPDADINILSYSATFADSSSEAVAFVLTLGGTNDGDTTTIHALWVQYTKKLLTS